MLFKTVLKTKTPNNNTCERVYTCTSEHNFIESALTLWKQFDKTPDESLVSMETTEIEWSRDLKAYSHTGSIRPC